MANDDEENEITVKVLQLVSVLVKCGCYHKDEDVDNLVEVLLPWLETCDDQLLSNTKVIIIIDHYKSHNFLK